MSAVPLTIQNGIYLQTKEFSYQTHLDTAHLMQMEQGKAQQADDLGMVIPWITTGYINRPGLWNLTGQGKNRLIHSGSTIFKWQQPIAEEATYSLEDVSGMDKPGIDGTTFKIKLNKRTFGNSAVITANKFAGLELYVTADEIRQDGDGFVYTVKLNSPNKKYKWFPKEYLQAGTIFFQIGSILGEYGQTYADFGGIKTGYREFYNYVGDGYANCYFTCTRDAALSKISQKCVVGLQQYRKVIEMYSLRPGSAAYDISRMGQSSWDAIMGEYSKKGYSGKDAVQAMKQDLVKTAWIPEVEMLAMKMVERDIEEYATWGSGGVLDVEGKTQVHAPLGVFHQLNLGPTYNYNIPGFQLKKLDAWITSRLKDKIDPYGQNEIVIGTGLGGMKLVRNQLKQEANAAGIVFDSERYVKGGDNMNLTLDLPNFIKYRMAFGWVRFEYVPSFDPIAANDVENPMVDGHRLSSYMFVIDDLTAQNDNMYEVVYGPDFDFHHRYINGRMNYMDSPTMKGPWQSSNNGPGFEVYIEKRMKAYHIKDITRSLLIKPYNPFTGKPLFEPTFDF